MQDRTLWSPTPARAEAPGLAARTPERALVPIGRLRDPERFLARIVDSYRRSPFELHVLNVQPPLPGHVAMYFDAGQIRRFHCEDAMQELLPARRLLRQAGIPYVCHIEVGDYATSIAACAREHRCRHVILEDPCKGMVSRWMPSSLASQVARLLAGSNVLCELV